MNLPADVDASSWPPYARRHRGTCLVTGFAWTFRAELARARRLRPEAAAMAINDAAGALKADFLYSLHRRAEETSGGLDRWSRRQRALFGPGFTVHAARPQGDQTAAVCPWIDHWWPGSRGPGTSAWCGAKVALFMGFDEVILVGVPLAPGSHGDGSEAPDFARRRHLANVRRGVLADSWMHPFVRSMGGWTRQVLGEPR